MKKIVIIGANEFQDPLIRKAKEMGYETHVFAWRDGAVGEQNADFFYPISIVEKEAILAECKRIRPDAVATVASDLANITVQYLARELSLPHNSDEALLCSTNKFEMRRALAEAKLPTPLFYRITQPSDLLGKELRFPMIVKPTDRSGSRAITKVLSEDALLAAIESAIAESFEKAAILEEYIEGPEYSCESISYRGTHTLLAVTEKFTTGAPHFIETGHIEPAPLSEAVLEKVRFTVFASLDALKIENGASHAEIRITPEGDVRPIEIGSRMGGDCIGSHLVPLSTGHDFLRMVIEAAEGKPPTLHSPVPRAAAIRFVFGEEDLAVLQRIRASAPEALCFVSEIEPIGSHSVKDSGSRYGFFILTGDSYEEIKRISELSE